MTENKPKRKLLEQRYQNALSENLKWFVKLHEARGVKFPKTEYLTQRDIIELVCQGVVWQPYIPFTKINMVTGETEEYLPSVVDGIEEMNKRTEQYKKEIKELEEK